MIFVMFLHLNNINEQFIRLHPTKKAILPSFFACLNCFIFFFLLSKISLERSSEIPNFFPSSFLALDIISSRWGYFKKCAIICGGLPFEETCFSTQWTLWNSRILLCVGFFFNSEKTKIYPPLVTATGSWQNLHNTLIKLFVRYGP